jgi:DNA invertase Pin-like site-specific DNA recombinase
MEIREPRPRTSGKRKAAIYLRISLDQTGEGLAIERQREDCERLAMSKGWNIVGEYVDNSISASKASVVRPGYESMVADLHAGKFDSVICYNIDRLTRQPRQVLDWIDWAQEKEIYLATVSGDIDLSTEMGRTMAGVFSHFARHEVDRKGARQARALRQRAELGGVPKGVPLTGYDKDGNVMPDEAKIVRRVFDLFVAGETIKGIGRILNEAGVKTRRGARWDSSTIYGLLRNARYCGRSTYRVREATKDGKVRYSRHVAEAKGNWEAIVSENTFDLVQARLNDPSRKTNRVGTERKHLGASLYLCGRCGGRVSTNSRAYWCPQGGHITRTLAPIDEFVLRTVEARLALPDVLEAFSQDTSALMLETATEAQLIEARLGVIENDYDEGVIDGRRYQVASEKLREQLAKVYAKQASIVGGNSLADVLSAHNPAQAFTEATLGVKRAVIDALMTVTLLPVPRGKKGFDPDSVVIEWKG